MSDWNIDLTSLSSTVSTAVLRRAGRQVWGPAWRWSIARQLVETGSSRYPKSIDAVTWQVAHHLRPLSRRHRRQLIGAPTLDIAAVLALSEHRLLRLHVESRVLAGLELGEVAKRTGLEESVVRAFCDVFLDVVDELKATNWILQQIDRDDCDPPDYLRRILLRDSYLGGPAVCEHWLAYLDQIGGEHDLSTETGRTAERLELMVLSEQVRDQQALLNSKVAGRLINLAESRKPSSLPLQSMLASRVTSSLRATLASHDDPQNLASAAIERRCRLAG